MNLKTIILLTFAALIMILISNSSFAQSAPSEDEQYVAFATTMPELEGGMPELIKKVKYPDIAKRSNIEGKVYAMAYVDEKGNVDKVQIIKGIGAGCDEEVIRVLKASKFKPGSHEGKNVKVKTTIAVQFKLKN